MIPNIVKGKGVTGAIAYAMGQGNDPMTGERLKLRDGEQSRVTILGGQNFGFEIDSAERVELARRMMEWQALPENQASKTRKLDRDCFHASLSWGPGQEPTAEEMGQAAESFLKAVGLERARAVFIAHDDTDHRHIHIIASRIDPETGRSLTCDNDYIFGQKWAARWEREHGQERDAGCGRQLHSLIDAVDRRDAEGVLSYLTRDKATFQDWEVKRALSYGDMTAEERQKFRADIYAHPNVIGLRETAESPISRYTTREVLASEMALQRNVNALARHEEFDVKPGLAERVATDFTLQPEQARALNHLTSEKGFAVLWGEAGTGKSHTLNATRAAYEASGRRVIGMTWTNDVAQQMKADGFSQIGTIASELNALAKGRTRWDRNTVLIVDEAAMVSTDNLARLSNAAKEAGAKLILAGDDRQLSSIERGGMFETLRQTHGAAILKNVQRVHAPEQKAAFNGMHEGEFLQALKTFEKAGGVHWTTRQSDTLKEMAARYTADVVENPDKRRFMFAYTNKDVAALNDHARALYRARGQLGEDHAVSTAHGGTDFATGDRIQFTGNGRTKAEKKAGFVNGRVGTVTEICVGKDKKARLTVELDTANGTEPQRVSFVVGDNAAAGEFTKFKYGYAGTIYRGQGRTLDEAYVGHSSHWRASASYVALTRHRESVHIFAARETVKDLDAMALGMARPDNKRAATAYQIDPAQLAGIETAIDSLNSSLPHEPFPRRSNHEAAEKTSEQPNSAAEKASTDQGTDIGDAALQGAAVVAEGIADVAGKAIDALADGLADLLGGGSSAPPRAQTTKSEPERELPTKRMTHAERQKAFLEMERQQRASKLQEIARSLGAGDAMTEQELQMEKEAQEKRSRDRGGGRSL